MLFASLRRMSLACVASMCVACGSPPLDEKEPDGSESNAENEPDGSEIDAKQKPPPMDPECEGLLCRLSGRCVLVNVSCAPTQDAHCRQSDDCSRFGTCTLVDGSCSARSSADCATSDGCKVSGQCVAYDGFCILPVESDAE